MIFFEEWIFEDALPLAPHWDFQIMIHKSICDFGLFWCGFIPVNGNVLDEVIGLSVWDDDSFGGDSEGHFPKLLCTGPSLHVDDKQKQFVWTLNKYLCHCQL